MIGLTVMLISVFFGLAVWLFGIRPYLSHRGITVITAANWGLSAWSDWQQCSEFARKTRDPKASKLSAAFILSQLGFIAGLVSLLCGI